MQKLLIVITFFFFFTAYSYADRYLIKNQQGDWVIYHGEKGLCDILGSERCEKYATGKPMSKDEYVKQLALVSFVVKKGIYIFTLNKQLLFEYDSKGKSVNNRKIIERMVEQIKYARESNTKKVFYEKK